MPYTKLDTTLIHSTVWREPHTTRIVWITMLAMANKHGEVFASVPGLADAARVTKPETRAALDCFLAPDPDSRTRAHDGRRIEVIDGGWFILNYDEHRRRGDIEERKRLAAERARRYRAGKRAREETVTESVTQRDAPLRVTDSTQPSQKVTTSSKHEAVSSKQEAELQQQLPAKPWLAPFLTIWESAFGRGTGAAVAGRLAKAIRPFVKLHGCEKVQRQLQNYVRQVEPQYANPQSFVQRFDAWKDTGDTGDVDRMAREHIEREERIRRDDAARIKREREQ